MYSEEISMVGLTDLLNPKLLIMHELPIVVTRAEDNDLMSWSSSDPENLLSRFLWVEPTVEPT